jgi:hypothetical protein
VADTSREPDYAILLNVSTRFKHWVAVGIVDVCFLASPASKADFLLDHPYAWRLH